MTASGRAGLLAASVEQGIRYDERSSPGFLAARLREACAHVGCDAADWSRFASNRNAELYRVGPAPHLLKVLISKPADTIEQEYRSLSELHEVAARTGTFRVPRPIALFEGRSAYLMEFVEGRSLDDVLRRDPEPARHLALVKACGAAVGTIHNEWRTDPASLDGAALVADLERLPWRPSATERGILREVVDRLAGTSFACARLYLDCDPVNVRIPDGEGSPVLLDPPERRVVDAVHWDLGAFLFGLRRAAWKWPPAAPRLARLQPRLQGAFLGGYAEGVRAAADTLPDRLLLELGALVRLAQLWTWWLRPFGFRHLAAGLGRAAYGYPWLARARGRAYRALRRTLDAGRA